MEGIKLCLFNEGGKGSTVVILDSYLKGTLDLEVVPGEKQNDAYENMMRIAFLSKSSCIPYEINYTESGEVSGISIGPFPDSDCRKPSLKDDSGGPFSEDDARKRLLRFCKQAIAKKNKQITMPEMEGETAERKKRLRYGFKKSPENKVRKRRS